MDKDKVFSEIAEIEREMAFLPQGSITKKRINDKDYFYHRVTENGKRKENYISFENVENLRANIEKRRELQKRLNKLKASVNFDQKIEKKEITFNTVVKRGSVLASQIKIAESYKKRYCIKELREYVFGERQSKVFILYGLRRTGKTTMMYQIISELSYKEFDKAALILVNMQNTLSDIYQDLETLQKEGYEYVFIDEVTLMDEFIENASFFSDIYATSGMKIVLSGRDSLGFAITNREQLYDRCIMLHTTFIPYREAEEVLGIRGIDEYIRYGGTMSNYNNDATFANDESTKMYIDTAIANNIQHSLKMYEYGGHFRSLLDLYEKGELTNVINRVVGNINHKFTKEVIEKTFDKIKITKGIMEALDILNKEDQSITIEETHLYQIKEYLTLLDLITEIDVKHLPYVSEHSPITVIMQPGMRYAQAKTVVEKLLLDEKIKELSLEDRQLIIDRLLSEVSGRMMEEIVLLETKLANPTKRVFKLQFDIGEFDMVVCNRETLSCKIYEVKYSKEQVAEQYRHLIDEEKCELTEHYYGKITDRYVIYRGESLETNGVQYLNVEEYLKSCVKNE